MSEYDQYKPECIECGEPAACVCQGPLEHLGVTPHLCVTCATTRDGCVLCPVCAGDVIETFADGTTSADALKAVKEEDEDPQ